MKTESLETKFASPYRQTKEEIEKQYRKAISSPYVTEILNALPHIALILNSDRQAIFSNMASLEMFGISDVKTLIGSRPGEIFNCVHANKESSGCGTSESCSVCGAVLAILESQEKNIKVNRESRITAQMDGQTVSFDMLVSVTPFTIEEDPYFIVSLTDISDKNRRRSLERIFFHDILNTAGAISGFADMTLISEPGEKDSYIQIISDAAKQLVEEINAQRELLNAESDDITVHPEEIRSQTFSEQIVGLFREHKIADQRDIHIDSQSRDVIFESDKTLLTRVLTNMVKNALEASAPGEVVTIRYEKRDEQIQFRVHNPTFIPRNIQLQIFQRSFSTKGNGRGLGTYSIKLLSERYLKGNVTFVSSETEGTTFIASYPLSLTAQTQETKH